MANNLGTLNKQILLKLLLLAVLMFGFGYALVPLYKALCEVTGINVVTSKNNYGVRAYGANKPGNTQVDYSRKVVIEFDSNSRGPFAFKPVKNFIEVHPGEMHEIVYEVVNTLDRPVAAQAIPSNRILYKNRVLLFSRASTDTPPDSANASCIYC